MSDHKLKLLLFGPIGDKIDTFVRKLSALQSSKAGPFDLAVSVGTCSDVEALLKQSLPLPVYLHHVLGETGQFLQDDSSPVAKLGHNLYVLQEAASELDDFQAGIWNIQIGNKEPLVVAACPPVLRTDSSAAKPLMDTLGHVSYIGCDLLLTHELPQGASSLLAGLADGAFDIADVALQARARYHLVPSTTFAQSPPFQHLASSTSTASLNHVGRLLTLARVVDGKTDKLHKFVHALGLTPLQAMNTIEMGQQTAQLPCPFTDASYPQDHPSHAKGSAVSGLSEASARRLLAEDQSKGDLQSQRFAHNSGNKRGRASTLSEEDTSTSSTLFVHGLHKDVSGVLQTMAGNVNILSAFQSYQAQLVRRPTNTATSSFCFVEFANHDAAAACLAATGGEITVKGVHLTVKWAAGQAPKRPKHERLTEEQAKESSSVYYRFVPEPDNVEACGEVLRLWMQTLLEDALNTEDVEDRVTAEDEPALQVAARTVGGFGFLDFASHAAASMALASLTSSVDGGPVDVSAAKRPPVLDPYQIYVHWAKPKSSSSDVIVDDETGFKFERRHFPPDSRQDCWFCLASESCEKHLIVGVYDVVYAAMPKGPVHPGHVLLIPVQHSSKGALADPTMAGEMHRLKQKLRQHAMTMYKCDLFVFERAIQTKHGYHTHVQCIPIDPQLTIKLLAVMKGQARRTGMDLREVNSDLGLDAVVGDDDGYFYAELGDRRLVHRVSEDQRDSQVPLQFGREVVASVLEQPELAHWKSCVLSTEEEARVAGDLRESLTEVMGSSGNE